MAFNSNQKKWIFVILFVLLLISAVYMLKPYLSALFVGALLAYFLYPLYIKLLKKVKKNITAQIILSLGSVLAIIILLVIIVFPLVTQTQQLYQSSEQYLAQFIDDVNSCTDEQSYLCQSATQIKDYTKTEEFKEKSKDIIKKTSFFFFQSVTSLISSMFSFIISLVIVVFSLFYFLEKGEYIKKQALELIPIDRGHKVKILDRLRETISAVVGGNITAALIQGILGGFILWILSIPLALFWGLIIVILSFIPAVGPTIVWVPAAIILFIKGSYIKAIILVLYGVFVLGSVDNFVKPKLIGNRMRLSSFAIFLGVIGGLQFFGILGIFFGPIIIALLVTFLDIYRGMEKR